MENYEKCAEMFPKKQKNAQILLKSQLSAQECWKCKIVLQIRKSAQRNRDRPNCQSLYSIKCDGSPFS